MDVSTFSETLSKIQLGPLTKGLTPYIMHSVFTGLQFSPWFLIYTSALSIRRCHPELVTLQSNISKALVAELFRPWCTEQC